MTTVKISVWAFNNFTKFDAFVKNALGITNIESFTSYDREDQVKMLRPEIDLDAMLNAIKNHDDNLVEFENLRTSIFKKNGGIRKLSNKTIKYVTEGFFVVFDFIETKPNELRKDLDGNVITLKIFGEAKADMMRDGLCDETFTYDEYCDQCQDL
ncbi:hypothetical protein PJM36_0143 [Salmonella phage vB_SenM_UTK0005]|uniref:Uncharacterized protein n=2 Tax=Kuttervirus TaxID=2169536 RepID=A0A6G8RP13_9CAUD|nr:hypothetical protein FDI91_gp104 [Salmonella phage STML-13-1]YP_009888558.1 hypothetical protein HYQ35_gp032 [Salmonella phage barely]EBI9227121.1 hypothetical protein [Salmonella enterica]WDR21428.1 hypothetical protein PJM36_0143 [Salmonella phage vB_SenM_UTK0005]AFU64243.1 hypothetical protein [Salmonella phage STML-13-1]QIO03040.1 hypothetical protein barely_32 [Salmonella phage barely]